ncbi:MAG: quinol:cytochrome C oxidoreductase [Myxococcota bacterium]
MATSKNSGDKGKSEQKKGESSAKAEKAAESAHESFGDNIRAGAVASSLVTKAGAVAALGLGATAVLGMMQNDGWKRFSLSYLTAFMWALTIGLGALFWVLLQHLVGAKWSTALRRLGELLTATLPVLGILSLPIVVPIFLGHDVIYEWANAENMHHDEVLHHKASYLNSGFFLVRFLIYFGFWTLISRYYLGKSLEQDRTAPADTPLKLQRVAGPAMIGFALTLTFCAFDLLMSLDPHWFSTIFGVYYFASCVLAINSTLVLASMWMQGRGLLKKSITVEHFHDLGKMMFAFTVFWTYVGFSQFMLIWYANLPEETGWYKVRFAGDWGNVSWLLLIAHFIIPFFGLLSRQVKRHRTGIAIGAIWILCAIYLDMYWLVMPNLHTEELPLGLIDITAWIGMAGALIATVAFAAKNVNLVPVKDPRLPRSLAFENI